MHLVGGAAVELEVARQRHGVGAALLQRLADVQRLQARQLVGLLERERAHLQQDAAALGGGEPAPGAGALALGRALAVERGLRGAHRGVDVRGVAARDARELAAVRGVRQRQGLAAVAAAPAAADEDAGGVEGNEAHVRVVQGLAVLEA